VKPERPSLPLVIAALARAGVPITPLPSPSARWGRWTLQALAAGVVATVLLRLRPDAAARLHDPFFMMTALVTLGLALTAAAGAFALSVPGARGRVARWLPLLPAIAWAALLSTRLAATGAPLARLAATPFHPVCVLLILSVSAVPGVLLFGMLRRAAPLSVLWTGALAALASLALGALGTQFVCTVDAPAHHLVWHVLPVAVLTCGGLALGARLFAWRDTAAGIMRGLR
jgi:hypothetical protein